jgi:hypothetical protein
VVALVAFVVVALSIGAACTPIEPAPDDPRDAGALECEASTQLEPTTFAESGPTMFPGDTPAGIERCDFTTYNRTDEVACLTETTRAACNLPFEEAGPCAVDSDCARGRCMAASEGCACIDYCATDDDCSAGEACVCSAGVAYPEEEGTFSGIFGESRCVPFECRTGADCPSGMCGIAIGICGAPFALRCRSEGDECISNADCTGETGSICAADNGSGWSCDFGSTCE